MSVDVGSPRVPELWSAEYAADPHPTLDWLRDHEPLHHDPRSGLTVLTRYDDVAAVLRSPDVSAADGQRGRQERGGVAASMLTTDGDTHHRLRTPAQVLLSPAAVRGLEPTLRRLTDRIVSTLPGEFDLERELCRPWATSVLSELLEVPAGPELDEFARIAPASRAALSPVPSPLVAARARQFNETLGAFLRRRLHRLKSSEPGGGAARLARDERLTDDEKVAVLALCVVGGWSPLADLGSSGIQMALADPAMRSWAADADSATTYLEELVRWHSPIPYVARRARADVDLSSGRLPEGAFVLALLGAANHDPARFTHPHEMRPDRATPSLAFGHGVHFCMGAALVRTAIPHLFQAFLTRHLHAGAKESMTWAREQFPRRVRTTTVRCRP